MAAIQAHRRTLGVLLATVVNRALQFVASSPTYAYVAFPAAGLTGTSWSIRCRVRPDAANGGGYVLSHATGATDKAAIIYNFVANTFEFFDTGNSTGAAVRLAITTATPPNGTYYDVLFTYDGAVLRGFLNGVAAGSLSSVFTLNAIATNLLLGMRNTSGGNAANVTIDYVRETEGGAATMTLELNEATPGPYFNTGSYAGQLTTSSTAPTSVLA